jgi:hypothetical protein|tara:strand:- start:657 stop:932 length:276 start_codon:yes stop_codon:yes gene_type:complete
MVVCAALPYLACSNKKPGKSSPAIRIPYRNRSGVVKSVGREPLMFARAENGVTQFSPKNEDVKILDQKQQFSMGSFHFFGSGKNNFFGGGV